MNHYETLGVRPDASADDIKQAFRRCARRAHPDREGGSKEEMQAINRAYEVLGDAERRKRYDESGDDAPAAEVLTPEAMARQALAILFNSMLDSGAGDEDPFGDLRKHFQQGFQAAARQRKNIEVRIAKAKRLMSGIMALNGEENFFVDVLKGRIANLEAEIVNLEETKAKLKIMMKVLSNFSFNPPPEEEKPAQPPLSAFANTDNAAIEEMLDEMRKSMKDSPFASMFTGATGPFSRR